MTLLAEQLFRIQAVLQDTDASVTNVNKVIVAHQEALSRLARLDSFANILWMNGVAAQAVYSLPVRAVSVMHVLYNNRTLRYASEVSLDRRFHGYEALTGDPEYWTEDNQSPNTIRLIPAPSRTGDAAPVFPSPSGYDTRDNLLVFLTEDPAGDIGDVGDTLPTFADWDDWLCFETARALAARETPYQNLPVSELCRAYVELWAKYSVAQQLR